MIKDLQVESEFLKLVMKNTLLRAAVLSSRPQITEAEIRQAIFTAPTQNRDGILNQPLGDGFNRQKILTEVAQRIRERRKQ